MQKLKDLDTRDPEQFGPECARHLHGRDARCEDDSDNDFASTGKVFVDGYTEDSVQLTWALPRGGGWVASARIGMVIGRTQAGLYSIAVEVKDAKGSLIYSTSTGAHISVGTCLPGLWYSLFQDPHQLLAPSGVEYPSEEKYQSFKSYVTVLANLCMVYWMGHTFMRGYGLDVPFMEYAQHLFLWYDPYVYLGILTTALVSIQVSRRLYLDSLHRATLKVYMKALT